MCWNAPVSLATFIVGSIISIIIGGIALTQRHWMLAAMSFGWLWPISMQLWEYFIWTDQRWSSHVAYVFNVTQILVLYAIFVSISNVGQIEKLTSSVIVIIYMCIILLSSTSIDVTKGAHLQYKWWDSAIKSYSYLFALITIFLLLVRPLRWSIVCVSILCVMLLFSSLLYKNHVPSLWCFFAVSFPIFAYITYMNIYHT